MDTMEEMQKETKRLERRKDHDDKWKLMTPLMRAAASDDVALLAYMLTIQDIQSSLFLKDSKGRTALDWARLCNNRLATAMLLKAMETNISNARIDRISNSHDDKSHKLQINQLQSTELFTALRNRDEAKVLSILGSNALYRDEIEGLNEVYYLDAQDKDGYTPLLLASGYNMIDAVLVLLDSDIPIDVTNKFGHTALTWACCGGHTNIVRILLFKGADIHHVTKEGRRGLHYACLYSKARVIKCLIEFLFERFSTLRLKHSQSKYDSTRWAKYARFMSDFMNVTDNLGNRPIDLLPTKTGEKIFMHTEQLIAAKKASATVMNIPNATADNNDNSSNTALSTGADVGVPLSANDAIVDAVINNGLLLQDVQYCLPCSNSHTVISSNSKNDNRISGNGKDLISVQSSNSNIHPLSHSTHPSTFWPSVGQVTLQRVQYDQVVQHDSNTGGQYTTTELHQPSMVDINNSSDNDCGDDMSTLGSLPDQFSVDTDNLHAEGLHDMADAHSLRSAMSNPSEIAAIYSLFKRVDDRIQQWKISALKEDELDASIDCWLGCGMKEKVESIGAHIRNICTHRGIECNQCRNVLLSKDIKAHKVNECTKRQLGCTNAWSGCREMISYDQLSIHTRIRCKFRKIICRLGCERELSYIDRDDHEQVHCKYRMIECDKCNGSIISYQISHHLHVDCPERMLLCTLGCGSSYAAKIIHQHEQNDCSAPCRWGCGKVVGPSVKKKLHETMICLQRPYDCRYKCNMGGLNAERIVEHEEHQCQGKVQQCPLGCGKRLRRERIVQHTDSFQGNCPERYVRCPSNLVGWKILIYDTNLSGIVLDYKRELYDDGSSHRTAPDGCDTLYIRFDMKHEWVKLKDVKIVLLQKVLGNNLPANSHKDSHFECGWIKSIHVNDHLYGECLNRHIWIANNVTDHNVKHIAGSDGVATQPFYGQDVRFKEAAKIAVLRDDFDKFAAAPPPTVTCDYCAHSFPENEMSDHQRLVCGSVIIRCKMGCGLKFQRRLLDEHVLHLCPKRKATCPNGCGDTTLWAEEINGHIATDCTNRLQDCKLGCNTKGLTIVTEVEHRLNDCELRLVKCLCGISIEWKLYGAHLVSDCENKLQLCPQSCGVRMPRDDVPYHCQYTCAHKERFHDIREFCPIGCGARLRRRYLMEHCTYHCKRRLTECPFKCGNSIQFSSLKPHLYFCIKRPICCEPGMRPCAKPIYMWMYPEAKSVDNDHVLDSGNSLVDEVDDDDNTSVVTFDSEAHINSPNNRGSNTINSTSNVSNNHHLLHEHEPSLSSKSSLFMSGGQYLLKSNLRFAPCERHGMTALMAAVRCNEYPLAEFLIKSTGGSACKDFDVENKRGDTALTLGCRLGRLSIIKLLILSNANQNKETSAGRTPLIEAIRSKSEHTIEIVEFLVQSGALVNYKTRMHGKSALDWARLYGLSRIVRILDLGQIVQRQVQQLFVAISVGNTDLVKAIVADGEFFSPMNETSAYKEFNINCDEVERCNEDISVLRGKMTALTGNVERSRKVMKKANAQLDAANYKLNSIYSESDAFFAGISKLFAAYEVKVNELTLSDIEEVVRLKQPDLPTRIALFAYGFLMGFLSVDVWSITAYDYDSMKVWWQQVSSHLSKTADALKRLKAFSLDKLQLEQARPALDRARSFYAALCDAITISTNDTTPIGTTTTTTDSNGSSAVVTTASSNVLPGKSKVVGVASLASIRDSLIDGEVGVPVVIVYNGKKDHTKESHQSSHVTVHTHATAVVSSTGITTDGDVDGDENTDDEYDDTDDDDEVGGDVIGTNTSRTAVMRPSDNDPDHTSDDTKLWEIPDVDWDSEADEAGGGQWVKGEWVPENKKKERWWLKEDNITSAKAQGSRRKKRKDKVGKEDIPVEIAEIQPFDFNMFNKKVEADPEGGFGDMSSQNPFVVTILFLLRAADKLAIERSKIMDMKQLVVSTGRWQWEHERKAQSALLQYQGDCANREYTEKQLITKLKSARFYIRKAKTYREKVRVARLLNHVSGSGHTAISWAASIGSYTAIEELLTHGSPVGFTSQLIHLTATYLQQTYAIYRILSGKDLAEAVIDEDNIQGNMSLLDEARSKTKSMSMDKLVRLKEERGETQAKLLYYRSRQRMPIPEAAYRGNWEVIERFKERRLLHYNATCQWTFPSPISPYKRYVRHHHRNRKLDLMTICTYGMNDLSCGEYIPKIGWVGANDGRDAYGLTYAYLSSMFVAMHKDIKAYQDSRARTRALLRKAKVLEAGIVNMTDAITSCNYRRCIEYAVTGIMSIDYETDSGYTALIMAATEDVDATNYVMTLNDNNQSVLAVVYLLDREDYRPGINLESKVTGMTAIMIACSRNRPYILQELLDRGADVNYINKHGRNALHYAAECGSLDCTRILLERNIDPSVVDNRGRNAFKIAEEMGFQHVTRQITHIANGFYGSLKPSRGNVVSTVSCPLGCGLAMYSHEVELHVTVCPAREVSCPCNCGTQRLMAKEIDAHIEFECKKRPVQCPNECGFMPPEEDLQLHLDGECKHRLVLCDLGCSMMIRCVELKQHHSWCTWRIVSCPQHCGMKVTVAASIIHVGRLCENRRVVCPLTCGQMTIARNVKQHLKDVCLHRPTACKFCHETFKFKEWKKHVKQCDVRHEECHANCGMLVSIADMRKHVDVECVNRFVSCSMSCSMKVRVSDMKHHQENECGNRMMLCDLRCYISEDVPKEELVLYQLQAKTMELHTKYECPNRIQICGMCNQETVAKRFDVHKKDDCIEREVKCSNYGCLKVMPLSTRYEHERHKCRFRLVTCKQGCGDNLTVIRLGHHMITTCSMRSVECPMKCGEKMKYMYLSEHMEHACTRRHQLQQLTYNSNDSKSTIGGSRNSISSGSGSRKT